MKLIFAIMILFLFIGCAKMTKPISESRPDSAEKAVGERSKGTKQRVFSLDDIPTTPVRYKSKVQPVYPKTASLANISGDVIIQLTVDENGMPIDIKPMTNLGYGLEACVIKAIQKTTFYPAKYGNKPVAKRIEVTYSFSYETMEDE